MKKAMFKIVVLLIGVMIVTGCATTENKALGLSSSSDGLVIKAPGSLGTGSTSMVDLWLADNCFSYGSAPAIEKDKKTQIVFTMTKRRSFLGAVFGIDDTSCSMVYIGTPNESAEETAKRISALTSVVESK